MRLLRNALVTLPLVGMLAVNVLAAQQPHGTVVGVVVDTAGNPVAQAAVILTPAPDQRVAYTDDLGTFRLDSIAAGAYTIAVRRIGFMPHERRVALRAGQTGSGARDRPGHWHSDGARVARNIDVPDA